MQFSSEATPNQKKQKKKSNSSSSSKKFLIGSAFIIGIAIVGLQVVSIILQVKPDLLIQSDTQAVASEVLGLADVNEDEEPAIAQIKDVEQLKAENDIQAQVYKDAVNGDYVVAYSNKMLIYRRDEQQIIYEGPTPGQILRDSRSALVTAIDNKAKEKGIIASDSEEVVQATVVTDPTTFLAQNKKFYKDLQIDDVVGVYNQSQIIVIYRPDTGEIVKSGNFGVDIQTNR